MTLFEHTIFLRRRIFPTTAIMRLLLALLFICGHTEVLFGQYSIEVLNSGSCNTSFELCFDAGCTPDIITNLPPGGSIVVPVPVNWDHFLHQTFFGGSALVATIPVFSGGPYSYEANLVPVFCAGLLPGDDASDGRRSPAKPDCGMPTWSVSEPYMSLWLHDEPLSYQPALGPRISFQLSYKQREAVAGRVNNYFNVGRNWNFGWFAFVALDSAGNKVVHFTDGTQRTFTTTNDYLTNTQLNGDTNNGFTVTYPDGGQEAYQFVVTNSNGAFEEAFLTAIQDPQAQKTRFIYNTYTPCLTPNIQLLYVIDGDGKTNTISYTTGNPWSANLISQVVDPFGRSVSFLYDNLGHLTNIIDVAGISTSFLYDQNCWVTNMTTPYGITSFAITDTTGTVPNGRSVLVTEADGGNELYLYQDNAAGVTNTYPIAQVPTSSPFTNTFDNFDLNLRNTFHWGRRQYASLSTNVISALKSTDFRLANMKHWLKSDSTTVDSTPSMERDPSTDTGGNVEGQKTWYDYTGKTNTEYPGTQVLPLCTALVMPDGSTRFLRTERNSLGFVTRSVESYAAGSSYRTNFFTYAANGQDLLAVTNALNVQVSSNAYNGYHEVLTNLDALGEMTVLTYNTNQQLTSVTWPSGLITTNLFLTSGSSSNHVDRTIDYTVTSGTVYYRSNVYTWANDLIATLTDPRGFTSTNTWDNLQRLNSVADARGTEFYVYTNLDLIRSTNRMGYTTSFGYDSVRRLIAATNANGAITRFGYCSCGSLQSVTNAFGTTVQQVTSYSYDNQGNRTQTLGPDGYAVNYGYNLPGQITNVYDAISSVTNWYNNQGLVTVASNAFGQVSAATYDILDRVVNSTDPNGVTVTNAYEDLNRLITRTYPDGGIERFGYTLNLAGVTSYTNQLNSNVVNFAYDALARKITETYPGISTNSFVYGPASDLLSLTDGKGQTTSWNYDQYGRNTNKVDATSTEILRFQYDSIDQCTNRWSKEKGNTAYSFDPVGNLTNVSYPVSHGIVKQYDPLNRITSMQDAVGTTSFSYTSAGQLQSEDGPWTDDTVSYTYNNRLRNSLTVLAPNSSPWFVNYSYDSGKRLTSVASLAGSFSYVYDPVRHLQTGSLSTPNGSQITNAYDSVSRLLATLLKNSSGTTLNGHRYAYNTANQRMWLTNTFGDYRNFTYDNIGELTGAHGNEPAGAVRYQEQFSYVYDTAGNLMWRTNNALVQNLTLNSLNELSTVSNGGTLTMEGTTTSPATNVITWGTDITSGQATIYASDNTWTRTNVTLPGGTATYFASAQDNLGRGDTNTVSVNLPNLVTYLYDANGNLTNDGQRSFVYDDENQLISVVVTNNFGNLTRSDFSYDGLMRRRVRRELLWSGTAWATNQVVRYVYDGELVLQERDANNLPLVSYTRGLDLSDSLAGAGGISGLLARTDHSILNTAAPNNAHAYYHADANGNITCLLNSNQTVVTRYSYDPFGGLLAKSGSLADSNLYRFSSKEFHQASGMVQYPYRCYDPNLQRWLNRDPIQEAGGVNLYGFVANNPANEGDALGLDPNADADRCRKCAQLKALLNEAYVADDVYNDWSGGRAAGAPNYERLSPGQLSNLGLSTNQLVNPRSGFYSALYLDHNTGNYLIAFRGTQPKNWHDDITDIGQGVGLPSAQYAAAANLGAILGPMLPGRVSGVGHSLGGGLGTIAALSGSFSEINFNAAGVHPSTANRLNINLDNSLNLVVNYSEPGDFLTRGLNRSSYAPPTNGRQVLLPSSGTLPLGINRHLMSNVIASIQRLLVENGCK